MVRNFSLDILKLMLAVMVVAQHTYFLSETSKLGSYLTINGVLRIAVPIFFMINGFFFHSIIDSRLTGWFKRALVLYVFWMAFYSYFWLRNIDLTLISFTNLLFLVFFGWHHLWYIPGMIGAGIMLFCLKKLTVQKLILTSAIFFYIGCLLQYMHNFYVFDSIILSEIFDSHFFYRNFLFFGFPFFALGYVIKMTQFHNKSDNKKLVILLIIGLILVLIESYVNFLYQFDKIKIRPLDLLISLPVLCFAIFVLFLKLNIKKQSKKIALLATSIWLVHPFVISICKKIVTVYGTQLTIYVIVLIFLFQ